MIGERVRGASGIGARVRWVVGIGARSGVEARSVRDALDELWLRLAPLAPEPVVYASVRAKAGEPGILAAIAPAQLVVLDAAELAAVEVPTPSERVGRAVGTPSVAEAAALAVASRLGSGARLAVGKIVGDGVTVAAACCERPDHTVDISCARSGPPACAGGKGAQ